jgi:hypothetical protein
MTKAPISLQDLRLEKDTPNRRPIEKKPCPDASVISTPRMGGLYHRYCWRLAA